MSACNFNLIGRLTRLLHTTDGTAPGSGWGSGALAGYDYAYDAARRLTEIDSFVDGVTAYTHDNTSQFTAADHTGQTDENYAYDENGNRTGGSYVTGDNNQTTEDGVYTYTYDAEGNRLTRTRVSDGYVTGYEWDHRNRLVSVTAFDDLEVVLSETTHDYDAFNQWIRRTVDSVETIFSHHDGQIVYQFDGDSAADLTNRYLWNPATLDHLLVDEVVANLSTAGDLQFPMGDHLGTIRDIAEYNAGTDTTSIANHIRYNSFGSVVSETNSAIDLLFGFTSRPFDDSTDLQNNLNRWFDGVLGQWASEDPIGFAPGDANIRRYVQNSSLVYTDPFGLLEDLESLRKSLPNLVGRLGDDDFAVRQAASMELLALLNSPAAIDIAADYYSGQDLSMHVEAGYRMLQAIRGSIAASISPITGTVSSCAENSNGLPLEYRSIAADLFSQAQAETQHALSKIRSPYKSKIGTSIYHSLAGPSGTLLGKLEVVGTSKPGVRSVDEMLNVVSRDFMFGDVEDVFPDEACFDFNLEYRLTFFEDSKNSDALATLSLTWSAFGQSFNIDLYLK